MDNKFIEFKNIINELNTFLEKYDNLEVIYKDYERKFILAERKRDPKTDQSSLKRIEEEVKGPRRFFVQKGYW